MTSPDGFTFAPAEERPARSVQRIAIVGGGAGGLELAARLGNDLGRRRLAEIVLIDPLPVHVWKPLLHEIAAGTLTADEHGLDFLQQARRHHFRFHLGALAALDRPRRQVRLAPLLDEDGNAIAPARSLWYDRLVIAIGSQDNDFGIPGVGEFTVRLNGPPDARHFHRRLLALITRAEILDRGPVHIVIVGGGATGGELAAELADAGRQIAAYGTRLRRYPEAVKLSVVESAPRLLSALPEFIGRRAAADLQAQGIALLPGQRVTEVRAGQVILAGGQALDSDLTVWAAGIRGADLLADLDGLESNRLKQLVVTPTLQTTRDERIFALGDCASCPGAPPTAQAAHQQARFLARSLRRQLQGGPLSSFVYHERGSLISLGPGQAVGNLVAEAPGRGVLLHVHGLLARFSYWLLYRRHLATLVGLRQTLLAIIGSWFSGRSQPRVKLH